MSTGDFDNKFLLGVLVGATVGLAAALLLTQRRDSRKKADILDHARGVASPRRAERAGRDLMKRVEDIRSAGM